MDLFLGYDWATDHLIRNEGNDNHWIEIELQGRVSNRDGIGALVLVTVGGVTQIREVMWGSFAVGTKR